MKNKIHDPENLENTVTVCGENTKCPWCKNIVPLNEVAKHKETCRHRSPVPTITGIDKFSGKSNKKKII